MAKNDLILLDGILDEYVEKGVPSKKRDEVFEYFATEQILKDYAFLEDQILSGSVDGRNDGGIDEFFVLVNGHLAENIPANFWPKSNAELEIYLITCKQDSSFKQFPINTIIPSLIDLFDFSNPSSNLTTSYNELVLNKRDLFISTYKRLASCLVKFDIHIVYACRGDEVIEQNVRAKADQVVDICQESFRDCTAFFSFWGNEKLLTRFRERPKQTLELKYEQCINQNGQYVVLSKLQDYCAFISNAQGKLNKCLFDSNVRDYLGLNPVNVDILESLQKSDGPDFWWLNNGITIIGSKAHIVGNLISIENVQIVNGLQTSETMFNYFSEAHDVKDQRSVLIKILISNNSETNTAIIYATNNQTNVNVPALRATDKIQHDIEDILKKHGFYYERRTNYYKNLNIEDKLIISPLSLASGYITLIFKNPFYASLLKQRFMRNNRAYEQVFSDKADLHIWVTITTLIKQIDDLLTKLKPNKNTNRFLKNYRQIVLFITISRLMGTFAFTEKDLIDFDTTLLTETEVETTLTDMQEIDENCFSKKTTSIFDVSCCVYIAKKYGVQAIRVIRQKNQELLSKQMYSSNRILTQDFISTVLQELPPQPWPVGIHRIIAKKLEVSGISVSNAISYLIDTKQVNAQVYGYVFDSEGNVVAEGEHFGYTEDQARKQLKPHQLPENIFVV